MYNYKEQKALLESVGYTLVSYVSSNEILVTTKQAATLACFGNPTITPSSQRVTFETQTRWNKTARVVVYPDGSWRYDVDRHNDEIVVSLRWHNNAMTFSYDWSYYPKDECGATIQQAYEHAREENPAFKCSLAERRRGDIDPRWLASEGDIRDMLSIDSLAVFVEPE